MKFPRRTFLQLAMGAAALPALPRMAGRQIAFRPYLLTCVRNAATDRLRRERRIDLRDQMPEAASTAQADDMALLGLEKNLVGEALQALPARWRTVLWLTEVEGLSPAEVSRRIGIKPNAVAALAYRARKGLREAYLQAHLKAEASEDCRATVSRLGNYVRGDLAEKDRVAVQNHLDSCAKCRCRRDELTDVNATLRNAFLPVPLLLAGLQRKAFNFTHMAGPLVDKAPDLSQTTALADNPLMHKALAGLSMLVLALSGTAVPKMLDRADQPAQVAQADTLVASVDRAVGAVAATVPSAESLPTTTAHAEGNASAAPAAASTDPAYTDASGGTRSTLFGGNNGGTQPGGSRQTIIHRPDDAEQGGLLAGTPVGATVDSLLSTVTQAVPVPLPVEATVSVPGVTGAFDAPLSVTALLPEGQSVAVQVPPALSSVLGGLLQPVTGALNGLTSGH